MTPTPDSIYGMTVLLVDDDAAILKSLERALRDVGCPRVITCQDPRSATALIGKEAPDAVLLDLMMPHLTGNDLLVRIRAESPDLPVIIVTALDEVAAAVRCLHAGAYDYLTKPLDMDRLLATLARAAEVRRLQRENEALKRQILPAGLRNPDLFKGILTRSTSLHALFSYVEAIAHSTEPVLIVGETGTGKELIAQAIHAASDRTGKLITVNVAGVDETTFGDTLFGHVRGAFTGANQPRKGLVEEAEDGTLFLDEIGDLKPDMQIKLLRLIQEREYRPLGNDQARTAKCRVIAATHCHLQRRVRDGLFREDLFYRLYAHRIHVPPLRERPDDIPLLVNGFLEEAAVKLGKPKPTPPPELFAYLSSYTFPGNVRELRSMVFDAVARHEKGVLPLRAFLDHMTENEQKDGAPASSGLSFGPDLPPLKDAIRLILGEALHRSGGNQTAAARLLGISRRTMNRYCTTGQVDTPDDNDDDRQVLPPP